MLRFLRAIPSLRDFSSHTRLQRAGIVGITVLLIVLLVIPLSYFNSPKSRAALTTIRQEINITDGYLYAASGSYATSSAIVQVSPTGYTGATYYFEVVASTTSATNATVSLVNASTGALATSVTVNGTSYARYRSTSFTPSATTEYKVKLGNESVGKGIIAARIVILQDNDPIASTQTQIEIGNEESYTTTSTSTFAAPKYWYYDSSKWDASPTFAAEVTYANTAQPAGTVASSTTYSTNGSFTVNIPSGVTTSIVELWGGGGGGGAASTNTTGSGSGGAGGQYAKKTIASLGGLSKTLVVGNFGAGGVSTAAGSTGGDSTWDTNVVVAKGGAGGAANSGSAGTGSTASGVGDTVNAGGNGAAGTSGGVSGGGGEGACSTGTGNSASTGTGGSGCDGGDGANGTTSNATPAAASAPGGGGAGGRSTGSGNIDGGAGGLGRAIVTNYVPVTNASTTIVLQESDGTGDGFTGWADKVYIVTAGSATSPTRVRSANFTPTSGRNYRIAYKSGFSGATFAVYNAKIVVTQISGSIDTASYAESNYSADRTLVTNLITGVSQGFVAGVSGDLTTVQFYLKRTGSPTGTIYARLTTRTEAGNPETELAISDGIDVSTISTSYSLVTFTFSGANQYAIVNGGEYTVYVSHSGTDSSNCITVGYDSTSPTYTSGYSAHYDANAGSWTPTGSDAVFGVNVEGGTAPTLLEPQYLVANSTLANGTALQDFLTYWDSGEWSGSTSFRHEVTAANNSSSVVELDTSGGSTIANSSVSSPDNRGRSSAMTMPSSGNIAPKATTNNGDVYSSRIIVSVSGTVDSTAPTPDPPYFDQTNGKPTPASATSITASSTVVTDAASEPVEYYYGFSACAQDGGTGGSDSGWTSTRAYTDTGLQPNQCYGYLVKARDGASPTPNYTATSTTASTTYTLANVPGTPTLGSPSATTFTLTHDANGNPSANPATSFAVQIAVTSGTDTTWNGKYVDGSGNPSASAVWLTDSQLDGLVLTGLTESVTYQATSKARNANSVETAFSSGGSNTTSAAGGEATRETRLRGGIRLTGGVRVR